MKYCRYCGKEIHENSSFCPYCMKSQIEKQSETIYEKSPKKWLYIVLIIVTAIIAVIAVLYFVSNDENSNSDISIESTEAITATSTEPILTTVTTSTTDIEQTTTSTEAVQTTAITTITATFTVKTATETSKTENETTTTETITTGVLDYSEYDGTYYPDGLTEGDVKGIYGYEKLGGVELFVTYIDQMILDEPDKYLDISIKLFTENDIIEVRHIYIDVLKPQNPIVFDFEDVYGGEGTATLLFENGKIHLTTIADEKAGRQTRAC